MQDRIRSLFKEYIQLISTLLDSPSTYSTTGLDSSTEIVDLLIDALCHRDELDDFLSSTQMGSRKCILNCEELDDYGSILSKISSPREPSSVSSDSILGAPTISLSPNAIRLVGDSLREFGTSTKNFDSWDAICSTYFPSLTSLNLRQLYTASITDGQDVLDITQFPARWSADEDYWLAQSVQTYGLGLRATQAVFTALHEQRSVDEIRDRINSLFRPKPKRRNRKKRMKPEVTEFTASTTACTPVPEADASDWSIDDCLLQFKSEQFS